MRFVCLLFVIAASASVRAQPAPPETTDADRLFEEGRALAKEKRYSEACDRFDRSFKLDPTVGTELNLADCHEQLGHLTEALRLFSDAADKSARTDDDKRTTFARARAAAVTARLSTLVVRVAQASAPGLAIVIGGRSVGAAAEIRERIDPGAIEIVATIPGHPSFTTTVKAAPGSTITVDVPAFDSDAPPTRRSRKRVFLALGIAGAGGISAITATLLTLKARSDYNATADGASCMRVAGGVLCDDAGDQKIADAQHLADIGTGFAVSGGVLLAAAAVLYVTASREPIVVTPLATRHGLGLGVSGSF